MKVPFCYWLRNKRCPQGMVDGLIEIGRFYDLEMNLGGGSGMRISRQPSAVQDNHPQYKATIPSTRQPSPVQGNHPQFRLP